MIFEKKSNLLSQAYEKRGGSKEDKLYDKIVTYESVNVAIVRMLKNTPAPFQRTSFPVP